MKEEVEDHQEALAQNFATGLDVAITYAKHLRNFLTYPLMLIPETFKAIPKEVPGWQGKLFASMSLSIPAIPFAIAGLSYSTDANLEKASIAAGVSYIVECGSCSYMRLLGRNREIENLKRSIDLEYF
jgi:hypothetical protein